MSNNKVKLKYVIIPGILLSAFIILMITVRPDFLQGNIGAVLGGEPTEDTTEQYLLASGENAATVLIYNQFKDVDFDGVLDQEDDKIDKFAVVKFVPGEKVQFKGLNIEFEGVSQNDEGTFGNFLINGEYSLNVEVDKTTATRGVSFVGREFYKQGQQEYGIIFVRASS